MIRVRSMMSGIEAFDGKVKELVLIGVTAQKIADCARKHGFEHIVFADSLEDAVKECAARAGSGDAVLLSVCLYLSAGDDQLLRDSGKQDQER